MRNILKINPILIIVILWSCLVAHSSLVYFKKFTFDEARALDKWGRMILNGQVEYKLMRQGDNGFVEAISEKNCSALYYRIGFKVNDYPILNWKWRVLKFPDKSKARTAVEKDDYAARVYVIFPFLNFSSSKFIEYIWDKDMPAGTVLTSPKAGNIKQIVVRNGEAKDGQWVNESRNVYEDYINAFGKKPGLRVGAVAIMCNADNTKSEAESLFDEIEIASETALLKRRVKK